MNRTSHPLVRLGVLAATVVGMMLASGGRATARTCVDQQTGSLQFCPKSSDGYDGSSTIPVPAEQVSDNSAQTLQWVLFAAAILSALAIEAVVADLLARRRWLQPPLEAALETSDADELPRAAGLLGDRFAEQDCNDAAEHAYRAAIDVDDEQWSPIAQVALADLLHDRGKDTEAQALLEAALGSGHPRAVPAAQNSLILLQTGQRINGNAAPGPLPRNFETLG